MLVSVGMSVSVKADERRRSQRTRVRTCVATVGGKPIAIGHARDISLHGMFVHFQMSDPNREPSIDETLIVRFSLPNFDGTIDAKVVVRRIELRESGDVRGVGLEFLELKEPGLSAVEAFVD